MALAPDFNGNFWTKFTEPPPFNLPITAYTILKYAYCKAIDPVAAAQWYSLGANFEEAIDQQALKEGKKAKEELE